MEEKKSVNQKINTLNINNNKSSTQPNPINQFSFAIFGKNWFIGGKFSAVLGRKFLTQVLLQFSPCFIVWTKAVVRKWWPSAGVINLIFYWQKPPAEKASTKERQKFNFHRDLFVFVNGTGDKTNCEIFVNGPFDPEMHIACYCRAKNHVDVKNKFSSRFLFPLLLQLIAAEVVDIDMRARFLKLLIITFPKNYYTRGSGYRVMEWNRVEWWENSWRRNESRS